MFDIQQDYLQTEKLMDNDESKFGVMVLAEDVNDFVLRHRELLHDFKPYTDFSQLTINQIVSDWENLGNMIKKLVNA